MSEQAADPQADIDRWVQEVCKAVSPELAIFAEKHYGVSILTQKGMCVPPNTTIFNIVLRERDDHGLLHELAHALLSHRELNPTPEQGDACEKEAQDLEFEWRVRLTANRNREGLKQHLDDYEADPENFHPQDDGG